ncbi:MAG: hypothetical protein ACJAY5_000597 [Actinomycetes bacterium]|jgi:hypothetical protein
MTATEPGPDVGTAEHAAPNGPLAVVVLADGDDEVSFVLDPHAAAVSMSAPTPAVMVTSLTDFLMIPPIDFRSILTAVGFPYMGSSER